MKTKMTCRVARLMAAVSGGGGRAGHVASCAECQAYFSGAAALDAALRREAVATAAGEAPAGLEAGILRAVREARRDEAEAAAWEEQASSAARWWRPAVTFGTMAAVLAMGSFVYHRTLGPGAQGGSVALGPAEARALVATVSAASERFMGEVIPKTGAVIAENPLQTEAEAVVADARSAVDFLKMNFLPSGRVAAN